MPLPDSAPRTYNAAQPFYSDDANQVVAWLVKTWEALGKEGFLFIDDFLGTALPPSSEQWAVTTTVGSQTQTRDDADAYGLLVLRPEAGERDRLQSHRFLFTGKTFRLAIRLRRYLALQAGDEVNVGLGGFAGGVIQLRARHGHPTYELVDDGGSVLEDSNTTVNGTFVLFELRSDGTNIEAWINGTKFWADALPNPLWTAIDLNILRDAGSANPIQFEVDFVKLWIATR